MFSSKTIFTLKWEQEQKPCSQLLEATFSPEQMAPSIIKSMKAQNLVLCFPPLLISCSAKKTLFLKEGHVNRIGSSSHLKVNCHIQNKVRSMVLRSSQVPKIEAGRLGGPLLAFCLLRSHYFLQQIIRK